MKYETPEVTVLTPAISAVQLSSSGAKITGEGDSAHPLQNDATAGYADWE
jgi:hypothetical protein